MEVECRMNRTSCNITGPEDVFEDGVNAGIYREEDGGVVISYGG
jgi:hypothetical protein